MKAEQTSTQGWRGVSWADEQSGLRPQDNIESLERAIIQEAQGEAQQIVESAQTQAQIIYQEAQSQVKAEGNVILERAGKKADTLRSQAEASARIDAQTLKLKRREQLLAQVFERARERLASATQWPDYDQVARQLVRDAVKHLGSDNILVRADPQTQKVLTPDVLAEMSTEIGIYMRPGEPLAEGTGIILETPDGHCRYDNRLETRLARIQSALRASVYHILTGEEP
ncbi:MAG: V-type ATP synthase subunit E [Anaerolineae bacterium]|jgi:V/A-type H+-transporting ATPase subunit E